MEKPGEIKIFESPNGGHTIYSRTIGSSERTLEREHDPRTEDGRSLHDLIMESKMWGDIHRRAKTDPALQDALDRVILLYYLSKK